ncbi:MAG: hypothetical protein JOY82_13265 [Streptosporangiaceae bacterium]|nr:hypothetical protein [Streptosporangiaceae bacterium]
MGMLAWWQARFRPARALALMAGMLVAATAFTVLTAASQTARLRTAGMVSANFVPAYDILVRPDGARTAVENRTGTVQPDFLSGIYGGITMAQYHQIQQVPGVQVAAPIAMVGYALLQAAIWEPVPAAALAGSGRQLYRISTTYVSGNGTSHITQPPSYLYVTPLRLKGGYNGFPPTDGTGPGCMLPGDVVLPPGTDPFGTAAQSHTGCWSRVNQYDLPGPGVHTEAGYYVGWTVPVLIAAIDPGAEADLDGLNKAVVSGGYLKENKGGNGPALPVLVSSASGMNEYAQTTLQQLTAPPAMPDMNAGWASAQAPAAGRAVATVRTTAQQAYDAVLSGRGPTDTLRLPQGAFTGTPVAGYWSVGPVAYQRTTAGALTPRRVVNRPSVWYSGSPFPVSMDDEDSQYRTVTGHAKVTVQTTQPGGSQLALLKIAGVFDPARIKSFDPLSRVPLGAYQPVVAAPGTAASRRMLHGGDLLPSQNLGGLVSQPVNLITALAALPQLENSQAYAGVPAADPISVIRVRVAGVTGPDALSRARVNAVAQQIAQRTGLDVDVVVGSSPSPVTIDLPAGKFGQPPLTLSEGWVKKGVAVAILNAVDKKSVLLFTLILVVCVLFVGNAAAAAVRGRRRELGVLAAVGWRRSRLFATVLGELAGIGLAAGLLAAVIAVPVSAGLDLRASPGRALLAVPVAIAVAVAGGLAPAWLAARADPVSSIRPPVLAVRRAHQPRGITSLALLNVARTPGRTLIGVVLNITERAAELAAIRSFGWRDTALARLVVTEGAIIGVTGSLTGAGLGLGAAAWFARQLPTRLLVLAAAAVAAGILITAAVALLPAALLRRLPLARLLAEE